MGVRVVLYFTAAPCVRPWSLIFLSFAQHVLHRHPHSTLVRASILDRFSYSPPIYFSFSFYFQCFAGPGPYSGSPFSLLDVPFSGFSRSIKHVCSRPPNSICFAFLPNSPRAFVSTRFRLRSRLTSTSPTTSSSTSTRSTLRHIDSRLSTLHRILQALLDLS